MSSKQQDQTKDNKQSQVATSPWTEPFQRAQATATPAADGRDAQAQTAHPAETEANRPTQDALSAIFNGR